MYSMTLPPKMKTLAALLVVMHYACGNTSRRPNILMILADDLGYGDLSVEPFTGTGISTPELEKMAASGTVLTNFHVSSPVCTPSRASILTGLFSWRLNIKSIFGTGVQAHDHLRVVPNLPIILSSHGYYTAHVGKWHLGGMTPQDVQRRRERCTHARPGPNQHGFQEYVAMMEGPESPRLKSLLPGHALYSAGGKYLLRNDEPHTKSSQTLTDRQADEAVRIMKSAVETGKPFFLQVWFDAPHSPWEEIPGEWTSLYRSLASNGTNLRFKDQKEYKYATMVSSMDKNVGVLRRSLKSLGIAENTLVIFLSDNGPENGAGSAGQLRGRKRSLYEGGIRVPAIFEWKGQIPPGVHHADFIVATDVLPTLLESARVQAPKGLRIDGKSFLYELLKPVSTDIESRASLSDWIGDRRLVFWFKDMDGCGAAVWSLGYKFFLSCSQKRVMFTGAYDMHLTAIESNDRNVKREISMKPADMKNILQNVSSFLHDVNLRLRKNVTHMIALDEVSVVLIHAGRLFISNGNKPYHWRSSKLPKDLESCKVPSLLDKIHSLSWESEDRIIDGLIGPQFQYY